MKNKIIAIVTFVILLVNIILISTIRFNDLSKNIFYIINILAIIIYIYLLIKIIKERKMLTTIIYTTIVVVTAIITADKYKTIDFYCETHCARAVQCSETVDSCTTCHYYLEDGSISEDTVQCCTYEK